MATSTKQTICPAHINESEHSDPMAVLLESLEKLYAELEDLQNIGKIYFMDKISKLNNK